MGEGDATGGGAAGLGPGGHGGSWEEWVVLGALRRELAADFRCLAHGGCRKGRHCGWFGKVWTSVDVTGVGVGMRVGTSPPASRSPPCTAVRLVKRELGLIRPPLLKNVQWFPVACRTQCTPLRVAFRDLLNRTLPATPSPQPVHELEPTDRRNLFLSLLCLPSSLFLPPSLDVETIFSLMRPQCCLVRTNFPPLLPKDPILMGNSPFLAS